MARRSASMGVFRHASLEGGPSSLKASAAKGSSASAFGQFADPTQMGGGPGSANVKFMQTHSGLMAKAQAMKQADVRDTPIKTFVGSPSQISGGAVGKAPPASATPSPQSKTVTPAATPTPVPKSSIVYNPLSGPYTGGSLKI